MVSEVDGSVRESDGFKPPNIGVFLGGPWFRRGGYMPSFFSLVPRLGGVAHSSTYSDSTSRASLAICQSSVGGRGRGGGRGQRWRWWWRCGREEDLLPSLYRSLPVLVGVDSLGRVVRHPRFLRFFGEFRGWGR